MKKIVCDFVELHYPYYHQSKDVLKNSRLQATKDEGKASVEEIILLEISNKKIYETTIETLARKMPNGFEEWHETHFEIVSRIIEEDQRGELTSPRVKQIRDKFGTGGFYRMAAELTTKFETENQGVEWGVDKDYFDEIDNFINREFYENIPS